MTPPRDPIAAGVLDDIHRSLLARQYDRLPALSQALDQALAQPHLLTPADLRLIHAKAERNAATLRAVQRGIRSAVRRVAEIRSVSAGLVTYSKDGQRHDFAASAVAHRL